MVSRLHAIPKITAKRKTGKRKKFSQKAEKIEYGNICFTMEPKSRTVTAESFSIEMGMRGSFMNSMAIRPVKVRISEETIITKKVQKEVFKNILDSARRNAEMQADEKRSGKRMYEFSLRKSSVAKFNPAENCGEENGRINAAATPKIIPSKYFIQIFMG